eukprot:6479095-Amphidinium_carterae.1
MEHRRGRKGSVDDMAALACDDVPGLGDFAILEVWYAIMAVYVDDLLVAADDQWHGTVVISLQRIWETSSPQILGVNADSVTYLGVVVTMGPDGKGFLIHQIPYLADLLDKYSDLVPGKSKSTTAPTDEAISHGEVDDDTISRLRAALGAMLWLATRSRPDISWSHSMASGMIASDPVECRRRVVHMLGFAPSGSRSHSGTVVKIGGSLLTWRSHRQSLTALSAAEAELYAAVEGLAPMRSS